MSAYTRLLNLLEADRKAAVSKAGFALGKDSIKEAQELASKEAEIQKEIRRIERENRKRSGRKGLGGLLGGALGFALAGPLGIGTGLASGLGSLVGTRAAGARNRVEGIDPNLTLDENADFFKGQRENIENVVDDINAQLDEQSRNELTTDILSSIATGATGRRFGQGELGKKISGRASNLFESLTGKKSLDLGQKISNLVGGRGFVSDAETAGGIFAGRVEKAARDMSIGLDRGLLFDRPDMLAEEALADRFALQSPSVVATDNVMLPRRSTTIMAGPNAPDVVFTGMDAGTLSRSVPNVDSLISEYVPSIFTDLAVEPPLQRPGIPRSTAYGGSPSIFAPISDLKEYAMSNVPAGADDALFFSRAGVEDMALEDLPIDRISNEFNTRRRLSPPNIGIGPTIQDLINLLTTSSQQATAPTQSQLDSLQFAINPGLNAPFFANFPAEFNERQIRELLNAPEGDINRLLEFYGIQR